MTSLDINGNTKFNEEGILVINELTLKQLYSECEVLIYHGIQHCGGSDMEIMQEYLGFLFISSFKPKLAKKTKRGAIIKSEFNNPDCYIIEVQKPNEWFATTYK